MGDWVREMLDRCEKYRDFDEGRWAPFKPGFGWDYGCCMLDVAYADHDEAVGPLGTAEARHAFAERVAAEEAAGADGAAMVRVLSVGFSKDSVLTHKSLGVFDFDCNTLLASCLDLYGGSAQWGCGNHLGDGTDTRWQNPELKFTDAPAAAYRRRKARGANFAALTIVADEWLATKRKWDDGQDS